MKRLAAVGIVSLGLAACVSTRNEAPQLRPAYAPPPPPPPAPVAQVAAPDGYRSADFAWSVGAGANSIMGSVAHHGRSGANWSCVGQSAALTPDTPYSADRIALLYGSADQALESVAAVRARAASKPGADYSQFVRSTTCDIHNAFAFAAIPDGRYFLIVRVHSRTRTEGQDAPSVIMQRIDLQGGRMQHITLPQPARPH